MVVKLTNGLKARFTKADGEDIWGAELTAKGDMVEVTYRRNGRVHDAHRWDGLRNAPAKFREQATAIRKQGYREVPIWKKP